MKRVLGISMLLAAIFALFAACKDPFTDDSYSYTVTFDKNGGDTEASPPTITVATPATTVRALPTAPTRTGYDFASWNTKNDGSGAAFTAATTVTASITVYAQWTPDEGGGDSYTININMVGNVIGDSVTVDPESGEAGDTITISYTLAGDKINNRLVFSGTTEPIDEVDAVGSGTRTYTVDADDANNEGVITINATFTHSNKTLDTIAFEDSANVTKTYGDAAFTRAVTNSGTGSGAITYASSDDTVATVVSTTGEVTIVKAGSTTITATKAEDTTYAEATASYNLTVEKKQLTVSGTTVTGTKVYDQATTAAVTDEGTLDGVVGGDNVSVSAEAAYDTANVGTGMKITIVYSISGDDADNYIKPVDGSETGSITAVQLTISGTAVTQTKAYDGTTAAAVTTVGTLSGVLSGDTVNVNASATYDSADVGTGKTITITYTLSGAQAGNYTKPADDSTITDGAITKAAGAALSGTLTTAEDGITSTSIEVNAITAPSNGQAVEYGIAIASDEEPLQPTNDSWQSSATFIGLQSATDYYIYARAAENANYFAGTAVIRSEIITTTTPVVTTVTWYDFTDDGNGKSVSTVPAVRYNTGTATYQWYAANNEANEGGATGGLVANETGYNATMFVIPFDLGEESLADYPYLYVEMVKLGTAENGSGKAFRVNAPNSSGNKTISTSGSGSGTNVVVIDQNFVLAQNAICSIAANGPVPTLEMNATGKTYTHLNGQIEIAFDWNAGAFPYRILAVELRKTSTGTLIPRLQP